MLWLAHQVSLLDQSAVRFERPPTSCRSASPRTLRIFAGDREPTSLLDRRHTDIACATIQTISRKLDRRSRRRTEVSNFLAGPTVVIVDEAHHVASRSYQMLLDLVGDTEIHDVVGLTATPWGQGERQDRIDAAFPQGVISRTREELIAEGVLAAYTVTPVRTHLRIAVTADEREQAARVGDLPMTVLRKLETGERNAVVAPRVSTACRGLGPDAALHHDDRERGRAHSRSSRPPGSTPARCIRRARLRCRTCDRGSRSIRSAVLISVGMLLEGVDLPEARTALIARATTSPNVLSQMVGRVLRGVAAGGEATANVVYLQDDWDDFTAVLSPTGPWEGGDGAPRAPGRPTWRPRSPRRCERRGDRPEAGPAARRADRARAAPDRRRLRTRRRHRPGLRSPVRPAARAPPARRPVPLARRRASPAGRRGASRAPSSGTSPSMARRPRSTLWLAASRRSTSPARCPTTRRGPSPNGRR